jgi:hypothetical protein
MDIKDPVRVYSAGDAFEAEIVKNALEAEGIRCFLEGENQAALPGNPALGVHVWAEAGKADQARQIIEAHEAHRHRSSEP